MEEARGIYYCSRRCGRRGERVRKGKPLAAHHPSGLSPRRLQVVHGIWQCKMLKQIAADLGLSLGTVKIYSLEAARRLQVEGKVGLALWYERHPEFHIEA